jgi:hypothetical protein
MKRPLLVAGILAGSMLAALRGQAAEFHGLDTQPQWSERGALSIQITNWSKLEVPIGPLTVSLGAGTAQPCRWNVDGGGKLLPTKRRVVSIADEKAVGECLGRLKQPVKNVAAALRFAHIPRGQEAKANRPVLHIEAEVSHGDRKLRALSHWSLEPGVQK